VIGNWLSLRSSYGGRDPTLSTLPEEWLLLLDELEEEEDDDALERERDLP
jgi:hypothetical protein